MSQEILVFEIDDGLFAVPIITVREVLRAAAVFPLPEYPDLVRGGLNLRGEIVPVVDGRTILRCERRPIAPADHMIVIGCDSRGVAIHVDRALALVEISDEVPLAPPQKGKYVIAVVNSEYGPTTILNAEALIDASHSPVSVTGGPR